MICAIALAMMDSALYAAPSVASGSLAVHALVASTTARSIRPRRLGLTTDTGPERRSLRSSVKTRVRCSFSAVGFGSGVTKDSTAASEATGFSDMREIVPTNAVLLHQPVKRGAIDIGQASGLGHV